jgi:hypothetical protein
LKIYTFEKMKITPEEIDRLLNQPNTTKLCGKRDYIILSLLCNGVSKARIARLRALDFNIEDGWLVFSGKVYLRPQTKVTWDTYVRTLIKLMGAEFVKTQPVLISFSTNGLSTGNLDFGITPEAIQQLVEKYFKRAGIEKKPYAKLFKQAKPADKKKATSATKPSKKFIPKRWLRPARGLLEKRARKNKRYRTRKRYARYKFRLIEHNFCLDANFLTRKGFFKRGRGGHGWLYTCSNQKNGFLGEVKIELIGSPHRDEIAIRIEPSAELWANPSTIRVVDEDCRLGGIRWCFYCPKCERKVFTLFYHFAKGWWTYRVLACRRCHSLVYLSQMRGWQRIGEEEYIKSKAQYKVQKEFKLWSADL